MLCKYCGKEIKYRADRTYRIYCCNECRMKALRVEISCDECGKSFEVLKSQSKNYRFHFCSKECKLKSKKLAEYISSQIKNSEKYKESRKNMDRIYIKGVHFSPATEFEKGWQNTEKGKEIIKMRAKSLRNGISKPEKIMIDLIKKNNFPFKFVGDGQFIIDTKFPDFIYTKKGNKIIEVFSDYWHREDVVKYWHQTEAGTKQYYNDRGYNVLVIWEHELKENKEKVIIKIKKFLSETLEIDNIPISVFKEFIQFCNQEFDGETGMTLKYVWDNFKLWKVFFENMDYKLNHIIELLTQEEKPEKEAITLLSGRKIEKGGKKNE